MPQPLARVRPNAQATFDVDVLGKRPRAATLIAQAVAAWAYAETHLGNLLACILISNVLTTVRMYSSLRSFAVQKELLVVAAESSLKEPQLALFRDILTLVNRNAEYRHKFAHGIWGITECIPDGVLWAEPKLFWEFHGDLRTIRARNSPLLNEPKLDRSKIYVYKEEELTLIVEAMYDAHTITGCFMNMVHQKSAPQRKRIYNQLFELGPLEFERNIRLKKLAKSGG